MSRVHTFKLYLVYNDYETSFTTYINHACCHRCLYPDGLRVGGNRSTRKKPTCLTWTHVYTDGCTIRPIHDCGLVLPFTSLAAAQKQPGPQHCINYSNYSNYKAESETLMKAISLVENLKQKSSMAVVLTNRLSVIQVLTNNILPHLAKALQLLSNHCWLSLQRYPHSAEFLEMNKQTSSRSKVHKQSNQVLMWATKKRPISKRLWVHLKSRMPTTVLVGQSKWYWWDWE